MALLCKISIENMLRLVAWRVPNPPGADPLVAERALWRSSPWWTFRIFFIFSAPGMGRGSPERQGGRGVGFLSKVPGGGGGSPRGGVGGGEGAGRVSAGNLGELGGGLNIFFRGRNARPVAVLCDRGSAAYWKSLQIPVISSAHLATPVRPK